MKPTRIRAVRMVREIRDQQVRELRGKTPDEVVAYYRAAGEAALRDMRQRRSTRRRAVR